MHKFCIAFLIGAVGVGGCCWRLPPEPPPVSPPSPVLYYRLLDGVQTRPGTPGQVVLRPGEGVENGLVFDRADETRLLQSLATGWVPESYLRSALASSRTADGAWPEALAALNSRGLLQAQLRRGDEVLLSFKPAPALAGSKPTQLIRSRLSRFAYVHRVGNRWMLESPRTPVRVEIGAPELLSSLMAGSTSDGAVAARPVWDLLAAGGLAVPDGDAEGLDGEGPLAFWAFHDQLFHGASLSGRKGIPATGTYRWRGRIDPPPALRPAISNGIPPVELPVPAGYLAAALQQPFVTVLDQRRSRREPGSPKPLDTQVVGAWLYAAARVEWVQAVPEDADQVTYRPYPSGGARHPLEIYLWVRDCRGLKPGLYHYDPVGHALESVPVNAARSGGFADWDPLHGGQGPRPPVTALITARLGRTAWKYEDIAYRLIQNDLGALYQTLYLAATALGLGPCAIGNVDAADFSGMTGIDDLSEPLIGALTVYP